MKRNSLSRTTDDHGNAGTRFPVILAYEKAKEFGALENLMAFLIVFSGEEVAREIASALDGDDQPLPIAIKRDIGQWQWKDGPVEAETFDDLGQLMREFFVEVEEDLPEILRMLDE